MTWKRSVVRIHYSPPFSKKRWLFGTNSAFTIPLLIVTNRSDLVVTKFLCFLDPQIVTDFHKWICADLWMTLPCASLRPLRLKYLHVSTPLHLYTAKKSFRVFRGSQIEGGAKIILTTEYTEYTKRRGARLVHKSSQIFTNGFVQNGGESLLFLAVERCRTAANRY